MLVKLYPICYNDFTKKFLEVTYMASKELTTKNVTFRFGEEDDFQVQLVFEPKNGKLVASSSSISFLKFLKSLHLVEPSANANTWFNTCDGLIITCFSNPEYSFKIRKKASMYELKVIPGEGFKRKREEACKVACKKKQAAIN